MKKIYQKRPDAIQAIHWDGSVATGEDIVLLLTRVHNTPAVLSYTWNDAAEEFKPHVEFRITDGRGDMHIIRLREQEYLMFDGDKVLGCMYGVQFKSIYEEI